MPTHSSCPSASVKEDERARLYLASCSGRQMLNIHLSLHSVLSSLILNIVAADIESMTSSCHGNKVLPSL